MRKGKRSDAMMILIFIGLLSLVGGISVLFLGKDNAVEELIEEIVKEEFDYLERSEKFHHDL
jgi:hypothetical protein